MNNGERLRIGYASALSKISSDLLEGTTTIKAAQMRIKKIIGEPSVTMQEIKETMIMTSVEAKNKLQERLHFLEIMLDQPEFGLVTWQMTTREIGIQIQKLTEFL